MIQLIASILVIIILHNLPVKTYTTIDSRLFDSHQKNAAWLLSGGKCGLCKVKLLPYAGSDNSAELDHVIPFSKNGKTSLDNAMMLCRKCNRIKSNK